MCVFFCLCFFLYVEKRKRGFLSLLFSLCVMNVNVNVNVIDVNNGFEWGRNGLGSLVSLSLSCGYAPFVCIFSTLYIRTVERQK